MNVSPFRCLAALLMSVAMGAFALCLPVTIDATSSGAAVEGAPQQPAPPLLSNIQALGAGYEHTCALTAGGGVKCWGQNRYSQLGDGTTTQFRATPVDVVGLSSGVQALAVGERHNCTVTADGGVKCWGANDYGQLGDGMATSGSTPVDVVGLNGAIQALAAGATHTCALTVSGGVKCWGDNDYGQLGDGTTTDRSTPVDVVGLNSGVQALAAGYNHTCAVTGSGGVKCWGRNQYRQLGDGTDTNRVTPVDVVGLSSSAQAIAAGSWHTCVVLAGGAVKCWGWNLGGQLGDGTTEDRSTPVNVAGLSSAAQAITAGYWHTCALLGDGGAECWGNNWSGQLGDGTTAVRSTPVGVAGLSSGLQAVVAGFWHTCALTAGGEVKCWGGTWPGDMGDGTGVVRYAPVDVGLTGSVQTIATGGGHTCAMTAAGGVKCWGMNDYGQLGEGVMANAYSRYMPADVVGLTVGVQTIAAGYHYTCAQSAAGGARCWGANEYGQLGDGTNTNRATPVDVAGLSSGVQAVAAGGGHTCALTTGGGVKCWGWNWSGQVGDGTIDEHWTPVDVAGLSSGVQALAVGERHTCALTSGGGVKCWGSNWRGQLGDGTTADRWTPVEVVGLSSGVQAITAGGSHACALTTGGGVKCWGWNLSGQLGDGSTDDRHAPVDVIGLSSGVHAIAAGGDHTCALIGSGGVQCWGANAYGQLGDGTADARRTPVDVVGLASGVQAIASGGYHTCALMAGGGVKCWGSNVDGQLGVNPGWMPVDVPAGPTVRGRVLDIDLDPISDAAITYVDPSGKVAMLPVDAGGIFTFTATTTGIYTMTVGTSAYSFFPDIMRIPVPSDQGEPLFIGALSPDDIPLRFFPSIRFDGATGALRDTPAHE